MFSMQSIFWFVVDYQSMTFMISAILVEWIIIIIVEDDIVFHDNQSGLHCLHPNGGIAQW